MSDLIPQKDSKELFRMEKSVMTKANFDEMSLVSGDNIPEALLEYICYEHQYNIFGYGILDPAEFAKEFRFSVNHLMGRHPEPYQFQLRKIAMKGQAAQNKRLRLSSGVIGQENLICSSRLENALFILANYALNITSTSVLEDQTLIRQYGFLRVLEQFTLIQDGKTGKVFYAYKLDDKFRRNLSSMYLTTRRDSLVALRKCGLGPLYVFLLKLRDALFAEGKTATEVGTSPAFEYLCELSGIPEGSEPKYRKRNLNQALSRLRKETELDFRIEWVFGGANERYTPIFTFIPDPSQVVAAADNRFAKICRERERIDIAVHEFKHNLVEVCPLGDKRYSRDAEEFFYSWIRSEGTETEGLIRYALERTFVNLGCGIPLDIVERVKLFRFYASRRGNLEIDSWLRELFSGSHGFSVPVFKCKDDRR